jgi:hypothetical protein
LSSADTKIDTLVYGTVKSFLRGELEDRLYHLAIAEAGEDIAPINEPVPSKS